MTFDILPIVLLLSSLIQQFNTAPELPPFELPNIDIGSYIKPDEPFFYVGLAALAVFIYLGIRFLKSSREPDGRLIGDVRYTMKGESFGGRTYEYDKVILPENLDELEKSNIPDAKEVAEKFKQYKGRIFLYQLKIHPYTGSTISAGTALIVTDHKINHPEWSDSMGSYRDYWRNDKVHLMQASPAHEGGRIFRDMHLDDGDIDHLIFYPMVSLNLTDKTVNNLEFPQGVLEVAANMKIFAESARRARYNEMRAEASAAHGKKMEAITVMTTGENEELRAEYTQKRFDYVGEFFRKAAMSPIIGGFIVMMGCIGGYVIMKNFTNTQADPIAIIVLGGIVGLFVVIFVNFLNKGRVQ